MAQIRGIYETVLYGEDLDAMERFYAGVLGLRRLDGTNERSIVFRLSEWSMLLVFRSSVTRLPNARVPSHGADGPGHVALSIPIGEYDEWKASLARAGIAIEREAAWEPGGRSIYFRDPAGNSVELVAGQAWRP